MCNKNIVVARFIQKARCTLYTFDLRTFYCIIHVYIVNRLALFRKKIISIQIPINMINVSQLPSWSSGQRPGLLNERLLVRIPLLQNFAYKPCLIFFRQKKYVYFSFNLGQHILSTNSFTILDPFQTNILLFNNTLLDLKLIGKMYGETLKQSKDIHTQAVATENTSSLAMSCVCKAKQLLFMTSHDDLYCTAH